MHGLTAAQAAVLTAAKILIAGLQGVAAEVAKNIVLAGVGQLTLLDESCCAQAAPGNFLVPAAAPRKSRVAQQSSETLQHMNPLVTVSARSGSPEAETDLSFIKGYQVLLLAGANLQTMLRYDQACTAYGVAFYTVISRGSNSYFFANLHEHAYTLTKAPQSEGGPQVTEAKTVTFPSLEQALFRSWKGLKLRRTNSLFFTVQGCMLFEQ
ncbi:hypothetical protein WJX73_007198 [Symbiochloris irregularis]|uniref:THIF-type NAD/FAD binding fold domain-containing protein n=1 Tax=Symbiochloris irregularis TaxID=706552 RepID=A0AAW1NS52_9CHLO